MCEFTIRFTEEPHQGGQLLLPTLISREPSDEDSRFLGAAQARWQVRQSADVSNQHEIEPVSNPQ